jgi:hypothetical protein
LQKGNAELIRETKEEQIGFLGREYSASDRAAPEGRPSFRKALERRCGAAPRAVDATRSVNKAAPNDDISLAHMFY